LKPDDDIRGLATRMNFSSKEDKSKNKSKKDSINKEYLKTLKDIYSIKIDSIYYPDHNFIFTTNKLNQLGFETILNIKNLQEGKHYLNIERTQKYRKTDSCYQKKIATIPFWYYKE